MTLRPENPAPSAANPSPGAPEPLLTVVLPNFNHARHLPAALTALLAQERPADEIVVVDDGSTDDSLSVAAAFAARHPSVRIIASERNEGAIAALNKGMMVARGRYLYMAAADDTVLPGFFAHALAMLAANPDCGLFCGDTQVVDGPTGRPMGWRPVVRPCQGEGVFSPEATARLFRRADNFILTGSAVFRRDLALDKGGLDPKAESFADGLLMRKIAFTHGFCYASLAAAVWNVHVEGLSRSLALDRSRAERALTVLPAMIAADGDFPGWYAAAFTRRWRFASARLTIQSAVPDGALLVTMAGKSALDRAVLGLFVPWLNHAAMRTAALAWITLRLRPYRLSDLTRTALARRLERRNTCGAPAAAGTDNTT